MALKAGCGGPGFDAGWLRGDYGFTLRIPRGRPADGSGTLSGILRTTNSRFRTGADKGNPTV
jgi:hypothetical protein